MSSTNRGYERHKRDYYFTPVSEIENFLNDFLKYESNALDGQIVDPCAGGDRTRDMSYPKAIKKVSNRWEDILTIDIREDSKANVIRDYLEYNLLFEPDCIITNPPFRIALGENYNRFTDRKIGIIEKALKDVRENGWVIMLLRLNFFGTQDRKTFWDKYMPKYVFVHHQRISFTGDGNTDSIEYAHFCWQKGNYPTESKLKVI